MFLRVSEERLDVMKVAGLGTLASHLSDISGSHHGSRGHAVLQRMLRVRRALPNLVSRYADVDQSQHYGQRDRKLQP